MPPETLAVLVWAAGLEPATPRWQPGALPLTPRPRMEALGVEPSTTRLSDALHRPDEPTSVQWTREDSNLRMPACKAGAFGRLATGPHAPGRTRTSDIRPVKTALSH